ncbi:MAG: hypothetical protein R3282_02445 [Rhodothermales bacterium]|nr:hypothetical protein [Rhodothermales bacterium]
MPDRIADIEKALSEIRDSAGKSKPAATAGPSKSFALKRYLRGSLIVVVAALVPFLLLIKLSVWMYLEMQVPAYAALGVGATGVLLLLIVYSAIVSYRISGRLRVSSRLGKALGALVAVFCCYSLLFISAGNVKTEAVRSTYTSLHPLLRLAVSTLVIADGDAVVTDAARSREDYARMGLPVNERSLHFRQRSGYVHAVDLRTNDRAKFRNALVSWYFKAMGFTTLRHVGTADHLHVSLPVPQK